MNNSNRADPDNSARHVDSAASDVFNKTVITTCTILFNRSSRIASHSSFICSLCFFPLASTCWRTTRLLRHARIQCLLFAKWTHPDNEKIRHEKKHGNLFDIKIHLCRCRTSNYSVLYQEKQLDRLENLLDESLYHRHKSILFCYY